MLFIFLVIIDEASVNISVHVSVDRSTHFHLDICIGVKNSNTLATSCEELTHWKRP